MFGCETVKKLHTSGQTQCGIDVDIFEVHSSEGFHRADMNLLNGVQSRALLVGKYWSEMHAGGISLWEVIIPTCNYRGKGWQWNSAI